MIEIRNFGEQFARAAARVATANLTVEPSTLLRQYRVKSGENVYRVDFYRAPDGRRFAHCECKGAQGGYVCKHMAAALPLHLTTMRENHTAALKAADEAFGEAVEAKPMTRAELLGDFSGLGDEDGPYNYR